MKNIEGYAKLVSVRVPFQKSKRAWEYNGRKFIFGGHGPMPSGAVCFDTENRAEGVRYLDLRSGAVYTC